MKKKHELSAEEAMAINSALYEAHGAYRIRTLVIKSGLSFAIIEGHLKILAKHDLADSDSDRWKFTGAGFAAYANIMCGNPGE
jgi:hypothetical protein